MTPSDFPKDFQDCVRFHGHVCPGLAIGYAAAKAAALKLELAPSEDEEVVAIVENDSCAVDAVQVLLGCTFGKGNLIFRDWGKQVFTFFDRKTGRAARVSLTGSVPFRDERHELKKKIDSREATNEDRNRWDQLRIMAVNALISSDPNELFDVKEVRIEPPPHAVIVATRACEICGELAVSDRIVEKKGRKVCLACAEGSSD
jgi:formylmethanofuran dehydrogenase subunit E